jgi:3-oxoacyl-[acyl-carrier-protein] synthase-3
MNRYATIISTGAYLPEIERPNSAMRERFGEVIDKFEISSGIRTRFYAPDNWVTSDLATEAGKKALSNAGLKPEDLDLIILGTDSPDYITPATSTVVQYKLGAKNAGTFDVGCACASFPTGLNLAAGLIGSNPNLKYVMVIGAYMMHKLADWENDVMSFFYGDGAGAAILTSSEKPGFVSSTFAADGSYHKHW